MTENMETDYMHNDMEILENLPENVESLNLEDLIYDTDQGNDSTYNMQPVFYSEKERKDDNVEVCFVTISADKFQKFPRALQERLRNLRTLKRPEPAPQPECAPETSMKGIPVPTVPLMSETVEKALVEIALFASTGTKGIHDTGASKSVIGLKKIGKLLQELPSHIKNNLKKAKSTTVFRFGNNATLAALFAVLLPLQPGIWMRIEVVPGETPFLISNKFTRGMKSLVDYECDVMYLRAIQRKIPLTLGPNGFYLLSLIHISEPTRQP